MHTDDALFLCQTKEDLKRVYIDYVNFLNSVALQPNLSKVQEGRFANSVLDYCGYRFSGGYVGVSETKINIFKENISLYCQQYANRKLAFSERAFIKTLNYKINGFGHYYKYGQVANTFQKLDSFVRARVRERYKRLQLPCPSNAYLSTLGLRNFVLLHKGTTQAIQPKAQYINSKATHRKSLANGHVKRNQVNQLYLGYLEKLVHQNTEMIAQLKQLNSLNKEITKLLAF